MPGTVRHTFTDRRHGDLSIHADPAAVGSRRARVVDVPWTWLRQVHGARVVTVSAPGEHAGAEADAAVTEVPGAALAVQTADCAPVLLDAGGAFGVAHVGWRGLVGGVLEATTEALVRLGHEPRRALVGPSIRARCYEFGEAELDVVAGRYGAAVRATTADGRPALDLAAGVAAALDALGVPSEDPGTCTACSPRHWSHRARRDRSRQALVAWLEP